MQALVGREGKVWGHSEPRLWRTSLGECFCSCANRAVEKYRPNDRLSYIPEILIPSPHPSHAYNSMEGTVACTVHVVKQRWWGQLRGWDMKTNNGQLLSVKALKI